MPAVLIKLVMLGGALGAAYFAGKAAARNEDTPEPPVAEEI